MSNKIEGYVYYKSEGALTVRVRGSIIVDTGEVIENVKPDESQVEIREYTEKWFEPDNDPDDMKEICRFCGNFIMKTVTNECNDKTTLFEEEVCSDNECEKLNYSLDN